MKRNSFLTFLVALIPGAGEMFLGYMKKGLTMMSLFFGIWGIGDFLGLEIVLFALPIVWFYSFFTTLNLHGLIIRGLQLPKDDFYFSKLEFPEKYKNMISKKGNIYIGYVLIVVGLFSIIGFISDPILNMLNRYIPGIYNTVYSLFYRAPALIVSIVIVVLGYKLVKGKKNTDDMEDDSIKQYHVQQKVIDVIENKEKPNE